MDNSLDERLQHRITDAQLAEVGLTRASLGIGLKLKEAKLVCLDKQGIVVEMENGMYLTAQQLRERYDVRHQGIQSSSSGGSSGGSTGGVTYDGVVGRIGHDTASIFKTGP